MSNPQIPESYKIFARAIKEASKSTGIESFTVKFKPNFGTQHSANTNINGEVEINYRSTDGRGRPAENLIIEMDSKIQCRIIETKESCN